jgi:hypothetical protein
LFMDFTEHDVEGNIVDARHLPEDAPNRDEAKRLQDDLRKAIEPLERQVILRTSVRPLRPDAFYRASRDAAVPISSQQLSPPISRSSKQKRLVIAAIVVIAAGAAIGVVFGAADTVRLALKESPVTHSLARLVGVGSDSVSERTAPTAAPDAISEQIPATLSAQIPSAAESGGTPLDQVPAPVQPTSSNVAPAQPAELAQPAAATAEYDKAGPSGEGENASLPIDRNVSAVANAQPNASPPVGKGQEESSVLFREFLEWRTNQVKPQTQQQRPLHSSKQVTRPRVLRSHSTNVPGAAIKRTSSSSRTNDLGRRNPPDLKDSERRS